MKKPVIKVIRIDATTKTVELVELKNTLRSLQDAVGGNIEVALRMGGGSRDVLLLVDEEGKLKNLKAGFTFAGRAYVGNAVLVGTDDSGEFTDLPKLANSKDDLTETTDVVRKYVQFH